MSQSLHYHANRTVDFGKCAILARAGCCYSGGGSPSDVIHSATAAVRSL
jgi:hypothetical protein